MQNRLLALAFDISKHFLTTLRDDSMRLSSIEGLNIIAFLLPTRIPSEVSKEFSSFSKYTGGRNSLADSLSFLADSFSFLCFAGIPRGASINEEMPEVCWDIL